MNSNPPSSDFVIAFSTVDTEKEASKIARALIEAKLAACVNIIPQINSVYEWKGEVCEETEQWMVIKTTQAHVEELKALLEEIHPYEVPELIFIPIVDGLPDYLHWILATT